MKFRKLKDESMSDVVEAPLSAEEEKRQELFKKFVLNTMEQLPEFYKLFNTDPTQATKEFPELWQSVLYIARNLLAQEDLALERSILVNENTSETSDYSIENKRAAHWVFKAPDGRTVLSLHQDYDGRINITSDFTKKTNRGFDYSEAAQAFFQHVSITLSKKLNIPLQQALIFWKEGRVIRRLSTKMTIEDLFVANNEIMWREAFAAEDWYVERQLPQA